MQPTETHVPRISLTVPLRSLAIDLGRVTLAVSTTSSRETFPFCLIFFVFFQSHSSSFNALMTRVAADGTTYTLAWRFCTISFTADQSLGQMNLQYQLHLRWLGLSLKPTQFSLKLEFHRVFWFLFQGKGNDVVPLQHFLSFFLFIFYFFHLQFFFFIVSFNSKIKIKKKG